MSKYLSEELQRTLREKGVILKNEVIEKHGDLYVDVDVVTGNRRTVQLDSHILNESGKRVLRG